MTSKCAIPGINAIVFAVVEFSYMMLGYFPRRIGIIRLSIKKTAVSLHQKSRTKGLLKNSRTDILRTTNNV